MPIRLDRVRMTLLNTTRSGDSGAATAAEQLHADAGLHDEHAQGTRHVVAAHRSSRNQPTTSHTNSATVRPGREARIGSERTRSVGWASASAFSDGWSAVGPPEDQLGQDRPHELLFALPFPRRPIERVVVVKA
jgi:hypothetical protein